MRAGLSCCSASPMQTSTGEQACSPAELGHKLGRLLEQGAASCRAVLCCVHLRYARHVRPARLSGRHVAWCCSCAGMCGVLWTCAIGTDPSSGKWLPTRSCECWACMLCAACTLHIHNAHPQWFQQCGPCWGCCARQAHQICSDLLPLSCPAHILNGQGLVPLLRDDVQHAKAARQSGISNRRPPPTPQLHPRRPGLVPLLGH